jgi:DNA-binding response OmpR family regulator
MHPIQVDETKQMAHILVVDDEDRVLEAIKAVLEEENHTLVAVNSGQQALRLLETTHFDLAVLDIIMPEMTGLELIRRIRAIPQLVRMPILFLTARSRTLDTVEGLDAGADDYLTKPFDIVVLPARIRALLRRSPGGVLDNTSEHLTVGGLQLHKIRTEVVIEGKVVELTAMEHKLLYYLMQHAGKPVSIDRLLEDIWAYPPGAGNPNIVQVHITNLRNKLTSISDHMYIRNVRGQGYMIVP